MRIKRTYKLASPTPILVPIKCSNLIRAWHLLSVRDYPLKQEGTFKSKCILTLLGLSFECTLL